MISFPNTLISATILNLLREDLKKVFRAFCATKRNGMEMGLYVIENIIRTYGGGSELEGELDRGSTFTVVLQ